MNRPYLPVYDIIFDFYQSGDTVRKINSSWWRSNIQAYDSIRHCIKQKGFKGIEVHRLKGEVYLMKL